MTIADPTPGTLTALNRALILVTLTMTTALYAMTVTIANVALPEIQGAMAATTDQIAWVVTFNIVATAVVTPMAGWLSSRFGQRRVMLFCVTAFTAVTLMCGFSTSLPELVVWRIGQGAFGAPLVPLGQAIVLQTFRRDQQGSVMAVFGMGVVIGPILAPTLGGYLSEQYDWRWVFFMLVPVGLVALVALGATIRDRGREDRVKLDWTGFLALSVAVASFQLMLDRGERHDWFSSTEILLEAALAGLALYIFIAHTLTSEAPFLSPKLLRDRNYSLGILFALLFGMLNFTPMVLLPPLLQHLRDYPDSIIGLLLAARGVGTLAGFAIMFYASRTDPRYWLALGFACQSVAGWGMAAFDINLTTFGVAWTSALQGFGVGITWVPLTQICFATLGSRYVPQGTAIFHFLRNIGSSIFISVSVALVIRSAQANYADLGRFVSPFHEAWTYPWARGLWSLDTTTGLATLSGEVQRQALMIGYINAFHLFAVTSALVIPLILLVRWRR